MVALPGIIYYVYVDWKRVSIWSSPPIFDVIYYPWLYIQYLPCRFDSLYDNIKAGQWPGYRWFTEVLFLLLKLKLKALYFSKAIVINF